MDKYSLLNAKDVRSLFDYDPNAGLLLRKSDGLVAGYAINTGYRAVKIKGRQYVAHRLIWLHVYGEWPPRQIDHIDCDKSNNRIENLRLANPSLNRANTTVRRDNLLGIKGVKLHKQTGKYMARICVNGKSIFLGLHHKMDGAIAAYEKASKENFGEYARIK